MKKILIFFALLFMGTSTFAQHHPKKIAWLEGKWSGVGYQEALKAEWDVVLEFDMDKPQITIDYPSISCKGVWELQSFTNYRAEFIETINQELDNCGDKVRVIVTRIDDKFVGVAFFLPEVNDVVAAYTVLTRVEEKKK